jgi:hypothetical protein
MFSSLIAALRILLWIAVLPALFPVFVVILLCWLCRAITPEADQPVAPAGNPIDQAGALTDLSSM